MHPTKPEIVDGPHAQMLDAAHPKRAFRSTDCGAYFSKVHRSSGVGCQKFFKSCDDCRVAKIANGHFDRITFAKAVDHCVHERMLQRPRCLRLRKYLR